MWLLSIRVWSSKLILGFYFPTKCENHNGRSGLKGEKGRTGEVVAGDTGFAVDVHGSTSFFAHLAGCDSGTGNIWVIHRR